MTRRGLTRINVLLSLLLAAFVARVWLMALPSSLWVDELVTIFVIRFPGHASFSVAPQVPQSIYYLLPRLSWALFGPSEAALRLPSVLAMTAALYFIAKLAARLIHPQAAWLAVFVCLAFRNFDYFAVDARPYGLGIAIASASLLFLIRWLDHGCWADQAAFVILAALLWRVHLFYWPFYLVYLVYTIARRDRRATPWQIGVAAIVLVAALIPVALTALRIARGAGAHSFVDPPTLRNLFYLVHAHIVLLCLLPALVLRRHLVKLKSAEAALILCWWLVCPLALFAYSRISGNGVLIMRYVSLMLPGLGLIVTAIAASLFPVALEKSAALATGVVALVFLGQWGALWPPHDQDDWRDAAALERTLASARTPVLCISPFIEALPPVWTPDSPQPSFLSSSFLYYPITGQPKLLPFELEPESKRWLDGLLGGELVPSGEFVTYGSTRAVRRLDEWLSQRPELSAWRKDTTRFDMISVAVYRAPPPTP
jgi:mannosyltransferase